MTTHIVEPDVMHEWIDALVKKGAKAFIVCNELQGQAVAPSPRKPYYKLPAVMPGDAFSHDNLSKVLAGYRCVLPIDDLNWLSEDAKKAMQKPKGNK